MKDAASWKEERRGKSELVREALRRYMDDVKWRKLYRYGELKARESGISEADVVDIVHERRRETGFTCRHSRQAGIPQHPSNSSLSCAVASCI